MLNTFSPHFFKENGEENILAFSSLFPLIIFYVPFSMLSKHKKIILFSIFFFFPSHVLETKHGIYIYIDR